MNGTPACSLIGYTSYLEGGLFVPKEKKFLFLLTKLGQSRRLYIHLTPFALFMNRTETKRDETKKELANIQSSHLQQTCLVNNTNI